MALPHAPRLFIAGEADTIMSHSLVEKNMRACTHADSVKEYKLFAARTGREEVAQFVVDWIAMKSVG